jgi:hypothetical protein
MESAAHALVGRLVFAFSRLDANLALLAAGKNGTNSRAASIAKLEDTSFKDKLTSVMPAIRREYLGNPQCLAEWEAWLASADELRTLRNDLVHGRWGVNEMRRTVQNVVGVPGSPNQRETNYTLEELQAKVGVADLVAREFGRLRKRWPT